jgi:hypothetical protein
MDQSQKGVVLIIVGLALVIIDWTLLVWFNSIALTIFGICLCCGGISQTNKAKKGISKPYGYQPQPGDQQQLGDQQRPAYQPPVQQSPELQTETKAIFCPYCGSKASGRFCPNCGEEID